MTAPGMFAMLIDHPFFSTLPRKSVQRMAVHARRRDFLARTTIFRAGEAAEELFVIRRGLVLLQLPSPTPAALELLGPDGLLGWSWLFPPYRWHLDATTVEPTSTISIDAGVLRALMAADPLTGYEMMRRIGGVLFDRLRTTWAHIAQSPTLPCSGSSRPWAGNPARIPQERDGSREQLATPSFSGGPR